MNWLRRFLKNKKGAAMVEYTLLVAAVFLTGIVAFTVFGKKVADVTAVSAGILPGALSTDNKPVDTNTLFEIDTSGTNIVLDTTGMAVSNTGTDRYADLLGTGGSAIFVAPNN